MPFPLCTSLVVFVASAIVVFAAPSLTVKASTFNVNVDGLENLEVTTTVFNAGDETLRLLNDPRGVLDPFPENTFRITNAVGSPPLFNGAKVDHTSGYPPNLYAYAFDFRL
jgi:peptidyl-Lys metalloendopeptidase